MKMIIMLLIVALTTSAPLCRAEQTGPLDYLKDAEVVVSDSLASKLKDTGYLDGKKVKGTYTGVDRGFAVFIIVSEGKSKKKLFIPLNEIAYITGTERSLNF